MRGGGTSELRRSPRDPCFGHLRCRQTNQSRGRQMTTKVSLSGASPRGHEELRITGHSDLLYWWIVWAYGFFCAGVTRVWGDPIQVGGKAVYIHPAPWVGVSFTGL